MKILHLTPSLNPELGGPTVKVLQLVQKLRDRGIEAEIATTSDCGASEFKYPSGERSIHEGVPVYFFRRSAARKKEFIPSFPLTSWLWSRCREYDLIDMHYIFTYTTTVGSRIARLRGVPYTVRTMGQLSQWALEHHGLRKKIYWSLFEAATIRSAAAVHATSAGESIDIKQMGITRPIITLPIGTEPLEPNPHARDELRRTLGLPAESKILLFLSRVDPKKRPDQLIEAFGQIASTDASVQLLIAGSGDPRYVQTLHELTTRLELQDRVRFIGFITGSWKATVLQGSDAFVLPTFSENFGIAITEAMGAGIPVIIGEGAQIADEIRNSGSGTIVDRSLSSLVSALETILGNPSERTAMGERGRRYALAHYRWSRITEELAAHYRQLIER